MPTRLIVGGASQCLRLTIEEDLVGIESSTIKCVDHKRGYIIRVPRKEFSNMETHPGDLMVVTISLVKVLAIDEGPEPGNINPMLLPKGA